MSVCTACAATGTVTAGVAAVVTPGAATGTVNGLATVTPGAATGTVSELGGMVASAEPWATPLLSLVEFWSGVRAAGWLRGTAATVTPGAATGTVNGLGGTLATAEPGATPLFLVSVLGVGAVGWLGGTDGVVALRSIGSWTVHFPSRAASVELGPMTD